MQQILQSITIALQNIKANPLHTFLSTLGIIIGVAALVAILALGDGLEQTGREQIETTTSVQMMRVSPKEVDVINKVRIPRDTVYTLQISDAREIHQEVKTWGFTELIAESTRLIAHGDSALPVFIRGSLEYAPHFTNSEIRGRYFKKSDIDSVANIIVLGASVAHKWTDNADNLIGEQVQIEGKDFEVIGIIESESQRDQVMIPISTYQQRISKPNTAYLMFKSRNVEHLPEMRSAVENWLDTKFEEGKEAFSVFTYEGRVKQLSQGILVFKLVMGAITGISVLVGGIGIMNVLLISVTERTKEIGVRKAAGARKKDIVMQFISESVTISIVGCIIGWMVGLLTVFGLVEVINRLTDLQFQAALSVGSAGVVLLVALLIGIVFGTYPAWKAANLTPVDAIRHE